MTTAHETLARQTQQEALKHRCPFCHADPGQSCRTHRGRGREVDWPHSRRIALNSPPKQTPRQQALCCECGEVRTVSVDHYKAADPNRAGGGVFDDPRGWHNTVTLKCSNCGRQTRHAKTGPGRYGTGIDFAEAYQRYVLTGVWEGKWAPDRAALQAKYFAQFPRNPKLSHRYYLADASECRAAGQTRMKALCGADMGVPTEACDKSPEKTPEGELHKPDRIDWDTEFEDAETGLWWVDMQCVDCLRVSNDSRRKKRREQMHWLLAYFVIKENDLIPDSDVGELVEHLEKLFEQAKGDGD